MKTLYILLSRSPSLLSRTIYAMTRDPYTHVAIAFDQDLQQLYSSARWNGTNLFPCGPCREDLTQGLYARYTIPCALYELQVDEDTYNRAKEEVEKILSHQERYHYNIVGLMLCRLGIPFRRKSHFFCSQFVGEILKRSGAVSLPRDPCLLRPMDYARLPQAQFRFRGYTSQVVGGF